MGLQAIFFDMGGTIDTFRFTREYRINRVHVIRECLEKVNVILQISDEQLADMITAGAASYTCWNMKSNVEIAPEEIWASYFLKDLCIKVETLKPISEELAFLYETQLYIREMRPEVPTVLAKIKEMGLSIGCISNTQSAIQVPYSLKLYGIIDYFSVIVLSAVYGRRKPDPAIFYHAAGLSNLPTSACAYIGDKINRDILGSKRAGYCLSVQVKHAYDNGEVDEGATPDAVIHNLNDLIPILQGELKQNSTNKSNNQAPGIKALFFDAGDILYFRPNKDDNLNQYLSQHKLNPVEDIEQKIFDLRQLAFTGQMKRHAYYEAVIRLYGIRDPDNIEQGIAAISLDDDTVAIVDGVPETIQELKKRGFILGIITDTAMPYSKKLTWFDRHGFGDVWDTIVSSREIGVRKPAPSMYERALCQTGVQPGHAAFIGHKKSEIDGAKEMGMKTIAFNFEQGVIADHYIHHFSELLVLDCLKPI